MTATVLVVEDEPAILELIEVNLIDAGFLVQGAPDAESAEAYLRTALPDLVLLDWMLPGMSGLALARQLHYAQCHRVHFQQWRACPSGRWAEQRRQCAELDRYSGQQWRWRPVRLALFWKQLAEYIDRAAFV